MGKTYKWKINPFQDYLFASLLFGIDISNKKTNDEIYANMATILGQILLDNDDLVYLDFDVKKKNGYFRVICNNIVTALWLSGIFPKDSKYVMECNEFIVNNVKYKFNKKTKKLSINKLR